MATFTIRPKEQEDTLNTSMSKAAFNAIASNNRDKFGGSGFVEPGKHYISVVSSNINEGIYVASNLSNTVKIGHSSGVGVSKTNYPIFNANGVLSNIKNIGITFTDENHILLPPAPTVLPYTAILTVEQIASGVIKHADASNSGLIVNGKFDTDTSGWTAYNGATLSVNSGKLRVSQTTVDYGRAYQAIITVIGKRYIVEVELSGGTGASRIAIGNSVVSSELYTGAILTSPQYVKIEFVATTTTTYILLTNDTTTNDTYYDFDNISVFPADAISRQDFVYFKTNDVDLATVDFAYPLGLKQYLGADVDGLTGISVGAYSGALTASLFGTWQASGALVGKGYIWSTRTEAQKAAFRGNPANNTYSDGDKVRQVQGLMQVAMMKGDNFTEATAFASLGYTIDSADKGLWRHADGSIAIGIALVHRRNQGGYSLTYNPHGTRAMTMTPTNIADCFTEANLTMTTGYIGTSTPRPDGLFYDQVSVEDFKPANKGADLRSSAQVKQYKSMFDSWVAKDTAGKLTFYPVTTAVSLTTLATDGTRTLAYSSTTGRVYYTNATAQYQADTFIKLGAIL